MHRPPVTQILLHASSTKPAQPSTAVREAAYGRGCSEQARFAGLRPLDARGDVWHALTWLQDVTERFPLDRRQAIVSGLGMLSGSSL